MSRLFRTRTRDEWFDLLTKADVCVGKVYDIPEIFDDPQLQHRGMVARTQDMDAGPIAQIGVAIKLSDTPGSIRSGAPYIGQHTEETLLSLAYDKGQLEQLRDEGAI